MRIMLDTNILISIIFFHTPVLATAILENIDILITGDKDLRVVETEYPEIMTMSEFIEK